MVTAGAPPHVSVVIPTRDRPQLVEKALRSVLAQTYAELEVTVVDDGSTVPLVLDAALASDSRVRTLRIDESIGAGAARNLAVADCRAPLLAFLDDDDTWRPTKLERQVEALTAAGPDVDAAESGFDLWDGDRLVGRYVPAVMRDVARTLLERPIMQPSTVLLRTEVFRELGGFEPGLRRVEDWDLWVRFSDAHRVVAVPEVHVDRTVSRPSDELHWYREMVRLLEHRIDALPASERARLTAVHLLVESHLLAQVGERRQARSAAARAVRTYPASWGRASLYIARSFMGERVWAKGKSLICSLLGRTGREPTLPG